MSIERVDPVVRTVTLTFSGEDLVSLQWLSHLHVSESDPLACERNKRFLDRIRTLLEEKS